MRRRRFLASSAVLLVLATSFLAVNLVAPEQGSAQVTTTQVPTSPEEVSNGTQDQPNDLNDVFWTVFLLSVLVAAVWSIPYLLDVVLAYWTHHRRLKLLIPEFDRVIEEAGEGETLTIEELRELIRAADLTYQAPRGLSGLTRSLFAFAVLATISTVLFALVAIGDSDNDTLVQSIVAALVGAFTTIVGVYFGSRTAESATETAAVSARQSSSPLDGSDTGDRPKMPSGGGRKEPKADNES